MKEWWANADNLIYNASVFEIRKLKHTFNSTENHVTITYPTLKCMSSVFRKTNIVVANAPGAIGLRWHAYSDGTMTRVLMKCGTFLTETKLFEKHLSLVFCVWSLKLNSTSAMYSSVTYIRKNINLTIFMKWLQLNRPQLRDRSLQDQVNEICVWCC